MTVVGGLSKLMANGESCLPCTPDEEKRIINEIDHGCTMKEGDIYYVLSNRWYKEWKKYTQQDEEDFLLDEQSTDSQFSNGILSTTAPRPGEIDNYHLVIDESGSKGDDLQLQRTLLEGIDYVLAPQDVWKKLYEWYKGGPALPRKVISQGIQNTLVVEVIPLRLQVINSRDDKKYVIHISKKASLRQLYNQVKTLLGLEADEIGIWDYYNNTQGGKYIASNKPLEDTGLLMDQDILVEVVNSGFRPSGSGMDSTGNGLALVPVEPSRSSVTIAGGPTSSNGYSTGYISSYYKKNSFVSPSTDAADELILGEVTKGDKGGLAGLQNLGNTCFMNSALQCLVHTLPLVEYFMKDYSEEINKDNPIGMQGELAIEFGALLRKLWSSGRGPVVPRAFKIKLGRFAPQFSGYNQHDSHELLAFLLDGLHEDLNRVKLKPYIELMDANGRPDDEVANECWEIHKARNDSVIVDVCQGQYKSTLVCPECSKVSVTFDPFMYLSLPLPSKVTRLMTVTVFCGKGSALPMPYTVKVLQNGSLRNLVEALSTECCLRSDETLLLAEVYQHAIFKYLDNLFDPLSQIKDEDYIVAYRLPKNQEGYTKLEIIHLREEKKPSGTPLVTCLAEGPHSSEDNQNAVRLALSPLARVKPTTKVKLGAHNNNGGPEDEKEEGSPSDMEIPPSESTSAVDVEDKMEVDHKFTLLESADDKGFRCRPIKSGFVGRVAVDWSDRDLDLYDVSYLEDLPVVHKAGYGSKKTRQDAISLFSCLEAFLKEEPLGPDDMWFCPSCKEHRQASKKLDLWRLPEILVIHLKRFSYSRWSKNKLDTFVNFPIRNLDLKEYVKSSSNGGDCCWYKYELYAVSNHYGGLGGGHYSANAKVDDERKWYHFDDSHVYPTSEDEIKTSAAYVLFYRRRRVEQQQQEEDIKEDKEAAAASCSSSD